MSDAPSADDQFEVWVEVQIERAEQLLAGDRLDEAEALVGELLALLPQDADLHVLRSRLLMKRSEHEAALDAARTAARLAPQQPLPHRTLASTFTYLERFGEARDAARAAVRLEPSEWENHSLLAFVELMSRGRLTAAQEAAAEAVRAAPDVPEAHFTLGQVLDLRSRREEARTSYRTALALDPQHTLARHNLVRLESRWAPGALARGLASLMRSDPRSTVVRESLEDWARGMFAIAWPASVLVLVLSAAAGPWGLLALPLLATALVLVVRGVPKGVRLLSVIMLRGEPRLLASVGVAVVVAIAAVPVALVDGLQLRWVVLAVLSPPLIAMTLWWYVRVVRPLRADDIEP